MFKINSASVFVNSNRSHNRMLTTDSFNNTAYSNGIIEHIMIAIVDPAFVSFS